MRRLLVSKPQRTISCMLGPSSLTTQGALMHMQPVLWPDDTYRNKREHALLSGNHAAVLDAQTSWRHTGQLAKAGSSQLSPPQRPAICRLCNALTVLRRDWVCARTVVVPDGGHQRRDVHPEQVGGLHLRRAFRPLLSACTHTHVGLTTRTSHSALRAAAMKAFLQPS